MREYTLALLLLLLSVIAVSKLVKKPTEHFSYAPKKCANRPLPQYHDVLYGYTIAIPNPMYALTAQIMANADPNTFYGGMFGSEQPPPQPA